MIKNETLYVSGGMTNIPCFNFPMFDEVEHELVLQGAKHVYSPAENDRCELRKRGFDDVTGVDGYAEGDVHRYEASVGSVGGLLTWDFNVIVNECDGIVMLPDWEKSTGAKWERIIAEALGKHVYLAGHDAGLDTAKFGWYFVEDDRPMYLTNLLKAAVNDNTDGSRAASIWAGQAPKFTHPAGSQESEAVWSGATALLPGKEVTGLKALVDQFDGKNVQAVWSTVAPDIEHQLKEHRVANEKTGGEKGSKIEQYALIPCEPLRWLAEMYGRGALKYASRNWERGYDWSLSFSAMQRHAWAHWNGELLIPQTPEGEADDPTTGVPHLTAVAWHAFAMLEWALRVEQEEVRFSPLDDRPAPFHR